jgi:hypothetical protein
MILIGSNRVQTLIQADFDEMLEQKRKAALMKEFTISFTVRMIFHKQLKYVCRGTAIAVSMCWNAQRNYGS